MIKYLSRSYFFMILYFDTETTGLCPGGIIQLSYIMQDKNGITGKNFFFFQPYIEPSSTRVHGVTVEKLALLSSGKVFYDYIDEITADFESADLVVAHNFPFDFKFMSAEFERCYQTFHFKEKLDSMRYFCPYLKLPTANGRGLKYPKLGELANFFEVYDYDVSRLCIKLFKGCGSSHDSRFDIAQTFLSIQTAREKYPDFNEYLKQFI